MAIFWNETNAVWDSDLPDGWFHSSGQYSQQLVLPSTLNPGNANNFTCRDSEGRFLQTATNLSIR